MSRIGICLGTTFEKVTVSSPGVSLSGSRFCTRFEFKNPTRPAGVHSDFYAHCSQGDRIEFLSYAAQLQSMSLIKTRYRNSNVQNEHCRQFRITGRIQYKSTHVTGYQPSSQTKVNKQSESLYPLSLLLFLLQKTSSTICRFI